ncbi:MAG: hypothetical protein II836_07140 [Clostridia bacterium]|nr:hypothetical protein [Clostridia bacterium]
MKRLSALLLCLLLLLPLLTACSEKAPEKDPDAAPAPAPTADIAEAPIEEEEPDPLELLPEADFGGAAYHILGDVNSNWWIISLNSEEIVGEIINDTVFERNAFVEEHYNVDVTSEETTAATGLIGRSVKAGGDDYSVVWERINALIPTAQSGQLKNLYRVEAFDFEAPWWDGDSVEALTINGKLFFACNDINVHTIEGCSAMYFSKAVLGDRQLENPYEIVREYRWTLDRMGEMMRAAASDTNGDGVRNEGDSYGLVTGIGQYLSLINGAGERLVILEHTDEGDTFTLNVAAEPVVAVTEKVSSLLNDKSLTVIVNDDNWGYNAFYTDMSLFYIMQLGSVVGLRNNMENDFGIIPFPMKNEEQGYYTTSMEATAQAMCIPVSAADLEMIGTVTEAMAVYSDRYLIDAYYETTLKGKIARDRDTTEMLDILTGTRTFDYSTCYGSWNVYSSFLSHIQAHGGEDLASFAAKQEKLFAKQVSKTIDAYAEIGD